MAIYTKLEQRLIRFFYNHDKEKILLSKKIAKKFWRNEDVVMAHLEKKYGVGGATIEDNSKKKKKKKKKGEDSPLEEVSMVENTAPETTNDAEEVKAEAANEMPEEVSMDGGDEEKKEEN